MAHPTRPTLLNLCGVPYESWDQILDYLELTDILILRRSGSRFLKAVCEDHPTFCRDISLSGQISLELLKHRCSAATTRRTRTISLDIDLSFGYNDYSTQSGDVLRQFTSAARSAFVSDLLAIILPFHGIVDSLDVDVCGEHFHLLAPILAHPAPVLDYLRLRIVDYERSPMLRQLPPALFQGDAPLLRTVSLGFIVPPAIALVTFPGVTTLEGNTNHSELAMLVPVGFQHMFPSVESLVLAGENWNASHCDVDTIRYLTASTPLKHLRLDFEEEGESARLLEHLPTNHLESVVFTSYAHDRLSPFVQQLAGIDGPVSLTVTAHPSSRIELEFVSTNQPHRSRALELSISGNYCWEGDNTNVRHEFDQIFRLLRDAANMNHLRITQLCIDVAAGHSTISRIAAEFPEVIKLALVTQPETKHRRWLEEACNAIYPSIDTPMQGVHGVTFRPDDRLRAIRSVELARGICTGVAEQGLSDRDANALVTLMERMPHKPVPLQIGKDITLSIEQHSAFMNVSTLCIST